jgi:flagellar basal-body rod protein FlgC
MSQQNSDNPLGSGAQSVQIARIAADPRPPVMVYNPSHPDADDKGMVAMPNINIHEEMVDMIASSRSYEANLAVAKNAHSMAMQDLAIGKS